jgi:hypothetical protein
MREPLVVVDPFAAVLGGGISSLPAPLWVPWPVPPTWCFAGLAHSRHTLASDHESTVTCWCGDDPFGDPVEVVFVSEEAGAGVGSHFAGLSTNYPGPGVGEGPPHARFGIEGRPVLLWNIESGSDRAVYAGEAAGRWLWVVVFPAEASAIVVQPLSLVDARGLGAEFAVVPLGELSPRLVVAEE